MAISRRSALLVAALLGITAGLTILLGSLHLYRFSESYRTQLVKRASLSAQIFTDSIASDLSNAQIDSLAQSFVGGDILFAQVMLDGRLVADERSESTAGMALSPQNIAPTRFARESELPNGERYIEVITPLTAGGTERNMAAATPSFIRIGFSLKELRSAETSEILIVIAVGLVLLLLVGGASILYLSLKRDGRNGPIGGGPERNGADAAEFEAIEVGELVIRPASKEVHLGGAHIALSPKEYDLIHLLASKPGRVFSQREILQAVWPNGNAPTAKDVKQYIYLLRRKLERSPKEPRLIVTVRGFGYKLEPGNGTKAASNGKS